MTNTSFWSASARCEPFRGELLAESRNFDVVVVGGGFTGLSTALHLAGNGASVAVMEAEEIGFGASGRNGGQVNPGLKHDAASLRAKFGDNGLALYRMGQGAPAFLFELVERLGIDCDLRRPGLVRLAHNAQALKSLRAAADTLAGEGVAIKDLDADDVVRLIGTARYPGGLLDPRGGSVQPLDLARGLARAAAASGVRIFDHARAMKVQPSGQSWVVASAQAELHAATVVVATNGYSDGLVPGLARSLIPVNSFQIATEPLPRKLDDLVLPEGHTVYDSRRLVLYFRRGAGGRLLLGGRASFGASLGESSKPSDYAVLESVLTGIFPQLKGIAIDYCWKGLVCVTPDFLPHYHQPQENLHVMLGYNGRGVAMANRCGAWLANKISRQADEGWLPRTAIRPLPFHGLRQPVLNTVMQFNRVLDLFGY